MHLTKTPTNVFPPIEKQEQANLLEPMTGMDIPCSGFGGDNSDVGGLSMNTRTG